MTPKTKTPLRLFGVLDAPHYTPGDDDNPATWTFQLILSAPSGPRLPGASAVLPCLVPGPTLREDVIDDNFPAGTAVEVNGFLDHTDDHLWFVVTELTDTPEAEPVTSMTVDDVGVSHLHGYTVVRVDKAGADGPWWSVLSPDGKLVGETNIENLLPVILEQDHVEPTSHAQLRSARRTELQEHRRRRDQRRPIR
jgi:hypothetical protein